MIIENSKYNHKTARHSAPQIPHPSSEHTCGLSTPTRANPTPAAQKWHPDIFAITCIRAHVPHYKRMSV
eukprot:12026410-Karenia_brevis.AAC.1